MKIGIYDPYLDSLGGGEKYMLTAAVCLAKEHDVTLFWDNPKDIEKIRSRFGIDVSKVRSGKNIFTPHVSTLNRMKQSHSYDAIFIISDGSIPILASKLYVHFQFPLTPLQTNLRQRLKAARVTSFICNSKYTKTVIDRTFRTKSVVLYPPVDIDDFNPAEEKDNSILTVGRYNRLPNGTDFKKQTMLIDTFKQLKDQGEKDWKLHIVTNALPDEGKYITELEEQADGYPIEIHKNISHKALVSLYNKAKIYWHAAGFGEDLIKHPERAEHFGIATVEAMAAGVVPIVIDAGGQKEIVHDGKDGFLWQTTEQLLQKTTSVIHNEKKREEMARLARDGIRGFSTDNFCREIHTIIR